MLWLWLYNRRFDFLLATLLAFLLIGPYIEYDIGPFNVPHVLIAAVNVAAVGAARGTRRHLKISMTLVFLSFTFSAIPYFHAPEISILIDVALITYTAANILRYVLHVPAVTRNVLVAAICVYLQIGLIFARLYFFCDRVLGHAMFDHNGEPIRAMPEFVYFSYTTLTTTGFGDIHPSPGISRSMSVIEAIFGQMFMVVLIGRLVGLSVAHSNFGDRDR
jgi:voltage-gated potassium channel